MLGGSSSRKRARTDFEFRIRISRASFIHRVSFIRILNMVKMILVANWLVSSQLLLLFHDLLTFS